MRKSEHIEHTPAKRQTLGKEELMGALEQCYGNIMLVGRKLGVSRTTVYKYIDEYGLNKQLRECRKGVVEQVQCKLIEALEHQDPRISLSAAALLMRHFHTSRQEEEQTPAKRAMFDF